MVRASMVLVFTLLLNSSFVFGLGLDHAPGDLPQRSDWPAGLYEAVNIPERVHGYWVNTADTLFYEGDHSKLNQMIKNLAAVSGVKIDIVLHAGPGTAKTAYSRKSVGRADWSVRIAGNLETDPVSGRNVTLDVWVGRNLALEHLKIPASLTVRSGGEIEAFVNARKSSRHGD